MIAHRNPNDYGWKNVDCRLVPVWITLPEAKDVFHMDVKCACQQLCCHLRCSYIHEGKREVLCFAIANVESENDFKTYAMFQTIYLSYVSQIILQYPCYCD